MDEDFIVKEHLIMDSRKHVQNSSATRNSHVQKEFVRNRSKKQIKKMNLQTNANQSQDVSEVSDFTENLANPQYTPIINGSHPA